MIVLVLAAAAVAALLLLRASVRRRSGSETLDFRGPLRGVEVRVATGEVTVRGSARRDARVRRVIRHTFRRPQVAEVVDDGVLRLDAPTGVVHYEVDVPEHASVTVRGETTSATVINVAGQVRLEAARGRLEGRGLAGSAVRAVTRDGSIRLSFDRAPDLVEVASGAGNVDLVLPDGDTDIRSRTPHGVRIHRR